MTQAKYGRSVGSPDLSDLQECPVWACYGDDDLDSRRAIFTDRPFDFDEIDPIDIRAVFTTPCGIQLAGYVAVDRTDNDVYLIRVWVGDESFGFNDSLQSWAREDLKRLMERLKVTEAELFPMEYRTPVIGPDGKPFAGSFTPFVDVIALWESRRNRGVPE